MSFELTPDEYQTGSRLWQRLRDHVTRELEWARGRERNQGSRALLAAFDGPARAIRCASAIAHHASRMGFHMRAGLHIGECEFTSKCIRGAAVDAARQIAQHAGRDEILVSNTVRDLVAGSGIQFQAKGILESEDWRFGLQLVTVQQAPPHGAVFAAAGRSL